MASAYEYGLKRAREACEYRHAGRRLYRKYSSLASGCRESARRALLRGSGSAYKPAHCLSNLLAASLALDYNRRWLAEMANSSVMNHLIAHRIIT